MTPAYLTTQVTTTDHPKGGQTCTTQIKISSQVHAFILPGTTANWVLFKTRRDIHLLHTPYPVKTHSTRADPTTTLHHTCGFQVMDVVNDLSLVTTTGGEGLSDNPRHELSQRHV
jgi:hypothetical protein